MRFEDLALKEPILTAIAKAGYTEPSPIQEQAIPEILAGRDLIACAQTGTGKTAAFALPILNTLEVKQKHIIRALILTPTRELAVQIFENFKMYGRYLKLRDCCVYGGAPMGAQKAALRQGCDILTATPGRLNDLMEHGFIHLDDIEIFVLDEADCMLDMGFINDVRKIVTKMPEKHQTLMFSATMPKEIENLAKELLKDPADVRVAPQASPADTVEQYLIFTEKSNKKNVLADILHQKDVTKSLVFTRTKVGADRLVKKLKEFDIEALAIHGDKTQGQRQNALQRFRTGQVKVLVATDVAARGIDIPKISHVFNYDLPEEPDSYIHRIGRTARAGKTGTAISLCCSEELDLLHDIEKLLKHEITMMQSAYSIELDRKKHSSSAAKKRSGSRRKPEHRKSSEKKNISKQKTVHTNKAEGTIEQASKTKSVSPSHFKASQGHGKKPLLQHSNHKKTETGTDTGARKNSQKQLSSASTAAKHAGFGRNTEEKRVQKKHDTANKAEHSSSRSRNKKKRPGKNARQRMREQISNKS
jgi:ATP-dependent RNA helicase RhlE